MNIIDLSPPLQLGEDTAVKVEISALLFAKFIELSKAVLATRSKVRYEVLLQRARIKEQCTFVTKAGKKIKITDEQLMLMSATAGRAIVPKLSHSEGEQGTVLTAGDGVSTAILYKFGTPIVSGGQDGKKIEEVEFLAPGYTQIEEILAGEQALFQTIDLIATVARPVGGTLMALPSWAIDQITLADGLTIMNKVLPSFLPSPDASPNE
jgi:hypothetical protein